MNRLEQRGEGPIWAMLHERNHATTPGQLAGTAIVGKSVRNSGPGHRLVSD